MVGHGLCYIGGLSVTNSILGVAAAMTGGLMGAMLQNPLVLTFVAALLVLLATSLHLGTLVAVVWFTRRELIRLIRGLRRDQESRRLGAALVVGTVPVAVAGVGVLPVAESLFASSRWVAVGLILTAVALWHSRRAGKGSRTVPRTMDAVVIGLAQAAALLPGLSRSGATIWAAMRRGITRSEAARFSFLLSIPATAGAAAAEIVGAHGVGSTSALILLLGASVAAVTGWVALHVLYRLVVRGKLWVFAPYCLALGLVAGALSLV